MSNNINFSKLQATGNDFVVFYTSEFDKSYPALAVKLCNRHFGVGADGVLLAMPSAKADIRMVVLNADGSEAQACGNGIRALARFAIDKGLVTTVDNMLTIETKTCVSTVKLNCGKDMKEKNLAMEVSMGKPFLNPANIPVDVNKGLGEVINLLTAKYPVSVEEIQMGLAFVGMGNPHAVYFQDDPVCDFPLSRIGSQVEILPLFPQKVNFEVVRIVNEKEIDVRIWERGVGETLACGSGACAAAVAAILLDKVQGPNLKVNVLGGTLNIRWDGEGEVFLSGPATFVFDGTIDINNLS
ncbi:MAG: diaminopimelate epimerase [Chloroflexi bacterium]|nr:diaminopimelate epimerase [Chloroflexota bacterium]